PQIGALLSIAEGTSIVTESIFESRFKYVDELSRMGANIKVEGNTAIIDGVKQLTGARVSSPDLRAGAALVIAGLAAEGFTIVDDIVYIKRGYEDFDGKLRGLGAEVVYDHADYRLLSARVLRELSNFREVNIYLRGMIPLVGFKSTCISYTRRERLGGKSHYPLRKMLALGLDGITSLSIRPIRMIIGLGLLVALISLGGIVWSLVSHFLGVTVAGWTSMTCIICFLSGVQLLCFGVIGEYIGKIYLETKARPRYIVSERTEEHKFASQAKR
ncbi:MAG: hypothetical protein J6C52_05320, partial [Clostridia bacterium]|nr:hypothetical protein [Clostridia bacterium]